MTQTTKRRTGDGGGCTSLCAVEAGWPCSAEPSACIPIFNLDGHPNKGDLLVDLTSPGGTNARLHNQAGGGVADIVGNYELSLPVDGPGALSDFFGGAGDGTWTVTIHDLVKGDTGILNSWAIQLTCIPASDACVGDWAPDPPAMLTSTHFAYNLTHYA